MKRIVLSCLALLLVFSMFGLCSCQQSSTSGKVANAEKIADLSGLKIAAQAGTFHAKALEQIDGVVSSTYPEFSDLLVALKSGAIAGYVAEEPTALAVCLEDSSLDYLHFKNNDTGFSATDAEVGIAVAVKKGSDLKAKIDAVLAEISADTRAALMEEMVKLSAGQTLTSLSLSSETPAATNGTLKVAMECAYEPFNWTDTVSGGSFGAVPISGEGKTGLYANGYDIQIAKYIANKLGMALEVYAIEWDSLLPALQAGTVDAIVAGMSPTEERAQEVDFSNVYYSSNLVVIYKK
ncbi:MAG: transporter substrate-binding domain-containing protein [Clostridia bacterium]|nr:transporter substrate-binding domain-containing protein [Clostridia bacterium]